LFDFGTMKVVLDLIPTGNGLRPNFVQPVGKVVLDLIPTGNGLRPNFVQPVGKVVHILIQAQLLSG
jgi:hypothetical protein